MSHWRCCTALFLAKLVALSKNSLGKLQWCSQLDCCRVVVVWSAWATAVDSPSLRLCNTCKGRRLWSVHCVHCRMKFAVVGLLMLNIIVIVCGNCTLLHTYHNHGRLSRKLSRRYSIPVTQLLLRTKLGYFTHKRNISVKPVIKIAHELSMIIIIIIALTISNAP